VFVRGALPLRQHLVVPILYGELHPQIEPGTAEESQQRRLAPT